MVSDDFHHIERQFGLSGFRSLCYGESHSPAPSAQFTSFAAGILAVCLALTPCDSRAEARNSRSSSFGSKWKLVIKPDIALPPEICDTIDMDETIREELDELKELIINAIPVEQIYLFGSYAYGTPHKDSDLDLYVVLKDDAETRELDAVVKILSVIRNVKTKPVDIIANKKSKYLWLTTGPTMERKIAREGIKIYG